jgi:diguanylate cyclase (GGDEF)-like protein
MSGRVASCDAGATMRESTEHMDMAAAAVAASADPEIRDLIASLTAEKNALLWVARAVAAGAAPAEVFEVVAHKAAKLLRVEAGIVWRFGAEGSEVVGTYGEHESQLGVVFPTTGDGAVAVVARTGRPARSRYDALDPGDPTATRIRPQGYTSGVAAPMWVDGRLWGAVLAATTGTQELPADAESRLAVFAELASLGISSAQAREDLRKRATTDDLTGALNQGEFHRRFATECRRSVRHGRPLSLVVVDLDRFKEVNDTFGHQVGDRVLSAVARVIRDELRGEDMLARVGGEEFALILPETAMASAAEAAERARRAVEAHREEGLPPVTVSAGVAELSEPPSPERLFAAADQALYAAKAAGRNRVCRSDRVTPGASPERP